MTPKEQAEALLDELIPFAEEMLNKHGEFFPFAGLMTPEGDFAHVAGYDEEEQPPTTRVRELIERGLRAQATRNECDLVVIVVNVTLKDQETGEQVDAIQAAIEHRAGYFVDVFFPYSMVGQEVQYGETRAQLREPTVFGTK